MNPINGNSWLFIPSSYSNASFWVDHWHTIVIDLNPQHEIGGRPPNCTAALQEFDVLGVSYFGNEHTQRRMMECPHQVAR